MDDTPTVGEDLARALAKLLVRKGLVTVEDMMDAADRADDHTERGEAVAHLMRVAIMDVHDAGGPPISETERHARFRHEQMRIRTATINPG
jgi:hypothetical protein